MQNDELSNILDIGACREIAVGVYCMETGKGINRSNVYFVRSGSTWVLIDTSSANCTGLIKKAAESLFGVNTRPACILLTHDHPDHAGAALELARIWNCVVYLHPDELDLAVNGSLATFKRYANPLDRFIILPLLRVMPRSKVEAMISRESLKGIAQAFDPVAGVPGLPDWLCIHTPGHSPGHITFFRSNDRVLITGDALVTANLNSLWGILLWVLKINKQKISGPPWYSTWNWRAAKASVTTIATLEPRVLAPGHGRPMIGEETARELCFFTRSFSGHDIGNQSGSGSK